MGTCTDIPRTTTEQELAYIASLTTKREVAEYISRAWARTAGDSWGEIDHTRALSLAMSRIDNIRD